MRIAVCGKGGSGKSTIAALLASEALHRGYRVLVVDGDESNAGLFQMLGFDDPPRPLLDFIGGREGLKKKMGEPNIFELAQITTADIPEKYILSNNGLSLVAIGKIMHALEGCACPMGALNREFLKKLTLEEDEIAIVDLEAGVEHFGRGIETGIDSILIVVEPPLESVNVGRRVHEMASDIGIRSIWAVLNKVPSEQIAARLSDELQSRQIAVAGSIHFNEQIFSASLEGVIPRERLEAVGKIFEVILPDKSKG
ncbi:MAG: adenylyl-sulfate kinase [Firmicutes bacterium]|nr:adenylyl-sulfate kinase [Bacillota bacterium]